jgi:DedD protein
MEKKKLLIVAVSVGVVLLIIIGIPLLMITPRQNIASTAVVERDWVTTVEPIGRSLSSSPLFTEPQDYTSPVQPNEIVSPQPVEAPHITLTVPVPQTAAVPDTPPAQTQKPSAVNLSQPAKPAPIKPVASAKPATPAPAAKPAVVRPASDSSRANNNYWVQTGAFSTKVRAEGAKESLASKGITSIIDNRDIDGKTWYRVRVGPYMSENEAKYWLALVKSIDGFTDSQIRQTQVQVQ